MTNENLSTNTNPCNGKHDVVFQLERETYKIKSILIFNTICVQ